MDKILELLRLFEKFGVKPGKIIGKGERKVTPIKKPILTKTLNRNYIDEDVKAGKLGINTVRNEIEDVAPLVFQKQLNDVELNNIINNLNYLDSVVNKETPVIHFKTRSPYEGKGLETLKETRGLSAPPDTSVGKIQESLQKVQQDLESIAKEPDLGELIKGAGKEQLSYNKLHNEGLVRAVARSILYEDIKAGKIKGMTLEQLGSAKDPIQDFRKIYGETALEQLDSLTPEFNQMYTPQEGAKLARQKFTLTPDETRAPGSQTYEELEKAKGTEEERSFFERLFGLNKNKNKKPAEVVNIKAETDKRKSIDELIDEYNLNQDRLSLSDEEGGTLIGYDEFNKLNNRNKEIAKALEEKGIKSTPEEKPEGIVIPFKKKPPEEFAEGGITRTKFASGGKGKKVLDIIRKANKELKGKKSMETVNPKTGEVTVPDEFITTAERKTIDYDAMEEANKLTLKHKEAAYAFDEIQPIDIYDKIAPDRVAEIMAEIKGKDFYDLSQKQQSELYKKAQSFLDDYKKIDRINTAVKKFNAGQELQAMDKKYLSQFVPESGVTFESKVDKSIWKKGDPITEENFGSTPFAPSQETLDNLEKARKMSSEMSLEQRMNEVLNQYDKSMFIKNEQGMVDVTNPQNIEKMALLLKQNHPEIYNEIFKLTEDINQKQILNEFDVTGRKPNASGGLNYLMGF